MVVFHLVLLYVQFFVEENVHAEQSSCEPNFRLAQANSLLRGSLQRLSESRVYTTDHTNRSLLLAPNIGVVAVCLEMPLH